MGRAAGCSSPEGSIAAAGQEHLASLEIRGAEERPFLRRKQNRGSPSFLPALSFYEVPLRRRSARIES